MTERISRMRECLDARLGDGGVTDRFSRRHFMSAILASSAVLATISSFGMVPRAVQGENNWSEDIWSQFPKIPIKKHYKWDEGFNWRTGLPVGKTAADFPSIKFDWQTEFVR